MKPFTKSQLKNQRRVLRAAGNILINHGSPSKTVENTCVQLSRNIAEIESADIVRYVTNPTNPTNQTISPELFIADIKRLLK